MMASFLRLRPQARPALRFLHRVSPSPVRFLHPSFTNQSYARCPSCSRPFPSAIPACTHCWNIFSFPPDITHHELLGLPYSPNPFVIDLPELKRHFREAQSICHPDSWASRAPDKQEVAHALSSRVNEAYQTLLRPLPRAEYILARNHLPMQESDQFSPEDAGFMANIMEARETIDEANDSEPILEIMQENDEQIRQTGKELESLVEQQDWQRVKAAAIRLRYLEGIERAVKQWLDNH